MTKIIFLDVDGPMVPGRSLFLPRNRTLGWQWQFDPCAVGMLNFLGWMDPAVRLVIASHRVGCSSHVKDLPSSTKEFWQKMLDDNQVKIPLHHHWITPRKIEARRKFVEISEWLHAHPEITHFVTLEDDLNGGDDVDFDMRSEFHLCAENYNEGFTHADFLAAAAFLGYCKDTVYDKYETYLAVTRVGW